MRAHLCFQGGKVRPRAISSSQKFPACHPKDAKGISRDVKYGTGDQESAGKVGDHAAIPFAIQDSFIRVCGLHRCRASAEIEVVYAVSMR